VRHCAAPLRLRGLYVQGLTSAGHNVHGRCHICPWCRLPRERERERERERSCRRVCCSWYAGYRSQQGTWPQLTDGAVGGGDGAGVCWSAVRQPSRTKAPAGAGGCSAAGGVEPWRKVHRRGFQGIRAAGSGRRGGAQLLTGCGGAMAEADRVSFSSMKISDSSVGSRISDGYAFHAHSPSRLARRCRLR